MVRKFLGNGGTRWERDNQKKEAGTKVLASQLFLIVEQDAVVEWALYLISSAFTALLNCAEWDDEIEF